MKQWLPPETINRLAADPRHCTKTDIALDVDLRKPFIPEQYTQLYYTPIYQSLHFEHRLRYNQLFGCRLNEYIMMLEADLVDRLLEPLTRHPRVRDNAELVTAIRTMIEEEGRHYASFAALNRACRPDLYPPDRDRLFSELPAWTKAMFAVAGLLASRLAFSLWYVMAIEESSMALAKDMMRSRNTETLGELDQSFCEVHIQHMKDEARHVQIDGILIDLCIGSQSPARRKLNAAIFTRMLTGVVTPTRGGSGVKVIRQLVRDMPELQDREEEMIRTVLALKHDRAFQQSLFNRSIMPVTFRVFDETEELADLDKTMVGYDRKAG